jgi:uncharacterized protein (DUF302 family)
MTDNTERTASPNAGIVRLACRSSVAETLDRLEALLKSHGVKVFARIDFAKDAADVGLTLPPEQQLIFGNPRAGTPLMAANPGTALDLPLRAICWQDAAGKVWLAYNDPAYVTGRHGLAPALAKNLAAAVPLIEQAAGSLDP